jgi:pectinesterase
MGSTNDDPKFKDPNERSHTSDKVNAVIDVDGVLAFMHPESSEGDESKHPSAGTYWFGYTKSERPDLWREASALTHVNKNAAPLLFFSSSVPRMHAGRNDYMQQLKQYGIYAEAVEYTDAPHSFLFFNPWFEPMVGSIDAFLKRVFE